jgi:hypothetical protein
MTDDKYMRSPRYILATTTDANLLKPIDQIRTLTVTLTPRFRGGGEQFGY